MKITFYGHRDTIISNELKNWLNFQIRAQIEIGANIFYFGGYGNFDFAAASALWNIKSEFPDIESIFVQAYMNQKPDFSIYDSIIYPPIEKVPPRYAIPERNHWMVDASDLIIANVERGFGGAAKTYLYALSKNKMIINYSIWQNRKRQSPSSFGRRTLHIYAYIFFIITEVFYS